jgi:hypothetical protein
MPWKQTPPLLIEVVIGICFPRKGPPGRLRPRAGHATPPGPDSALGRIGWDISPGAGTRTASKRRSSGCLGRGEWSPGVPQGQLPTTCFGPGSKTSLSCARLRKRSGTRSGRSTADPLFRAGNRPPRLPRRAATRLSARAWHRPGLRPHQRRECASRAQPTRAGLPPHREERKPRSTAAISLLPRSGFVQQYTIPPRITRRQSDIRKRAVIMRSNMRYKPFSQQRFTMLLMPAAPCSSGSGILRAMRNRIHLDRFGVAGQRGHSGLSCLL